MDLSDTIVAISSATGPAARMIVRLAGPAAFDLLPSAGVPNRPPAGSTTFVTLRFDGITCPAWLYAFAAPHSYTGDDLLELHLPGNPILARSLLDVLIASGGRTAGPGEFTARAFLNGRLDLAAAEGVQLTIAATHAAELSAARRMLAGDLAGRVDAPMAELADTLALLESNLDFADEGIAFVDTAEVCRRSGAVKATLDHLLGRARRLDEIARPPTVALVGLPNAGKSTLLNALAGTERAVVSPMPGTTRDVLSADVRLAGGTVTVLDLAGLETIAGGSTSHFGISEQMQDRARVVIETADLIVHVRDPADPAAAWLPRPADLVVQTKADLHPAATADDMLSVSAATGLGMERLKERLSRLASIAERGDTLALTARQADLLARAADALARVPEAAQLGPELAATELRVALDALGGIRGVVTPDDVLGRVFAGFCIGK